VLDGGIQERGRPCLRPESAELLEKVEEGLLQHVEGILRISHESLREPEPPVTVAQIERLERGRQPLQRGAIEALGNVHCLLVHSVT